ncbi:MAG: phenylacetate--CoA ligase family protein [Pseudonocardiaceae bacterium]
MYQATLDSLGRDEIEWRQRENLAVMVAAARKTSAVYRRWPHLDMVTQVRDLAKLPLLTPAELAAGCPPHSDEFQLNSDGSGLVLRSSGTAGTGKVMYHSWQFTQQVGRLGVRGVRALLPDPPRRVANCMFPAELNGAFLFAQDVAELLPALVFPLGSKTTIADTATVIAEHAVDTLISGPAYGTELVTSAAPEQLVSLRNFLYLGEPMGKERQRAVSSAMPDLTVQSLAYSTTETGPIGYQCSRLNGNTHHVHEDAVVVEIVDEGTGEPVPDGCAGEVVVTPLLDTGMALFRYRIGDRGYWKPEGCECGSAARLLTLLGRTAQSLNVDVWTISSDQLMSGLAELGVTDPADCQLQVLWDFPNYQVQLLLSPQTPEQITAEAVAKIFSSRYQMNQVLTSPRCVGFTVKRTEIGEFAHTERDKVPVLYQRLGRSNHQRHLRPDGMAEIRR